MDKRDTKEGLRCRNSPMCTLSQNGYGDRQPQAEFKSNLSLGASKTFCTLLDLCVSSLRRGHANLLCIVPILTDDPRRESSMAVVAGKLCEKAVAAAKEKGWSGAPCTQQRSLLLILAQCPTTAGSAQFCLLCCQPEPIPGTLAARKPLLTPRVPCRLPVWSRMNHLHELQDIVSSPTLYRQVLTAQESGFPTKTGDLCEFFFSGLWDVYCFHIQTGCT